MALVLVLSLLLLPSVHERAITLLGAGGASGSFEIRGSVGVVVAFSAGSSNSST